MLIGLFTAFLFPTFAQEVGSVTLDFKAVFNNIPIEKDSFYVTETGSVIQIDLIKFYVSSVRIQFSDNTTFLEPNSYHLIDLEETNNAEVKLENLPQKEISGIFFNLGIDSVKSVSGALDGDLDPMNGMYWAWQSGYINFKVEGRTPSCATRKNKFQFHIGGYLDPFYAMQPVNLALKQPCRKAVFIKVDMAHFFKEVDLSKQNSVMIPGAEALQMAHLASQMFSVQ